MKLSSIIVYAELYALLMVSFSKGDKNVKKTRDSTVDDGLVRRRRTYRFGSTSEGPCANMTHGVYLERWDRIDYKRVKFLLDDPRFPNLPSLSICLPTFEQPSKWGDFFGTRLRTYFVPLQTGYHYFYLSSDAGSRLYLSPNETPNMKAQVNAISGGFATYQYEYNRFIDQKSQPVYLVKGKYYYMEAIFKDDHQNDHLEVGLRTPDGTFYRVIPSKFLWTTLPPKPAQNATYQGILLKVAARAGARAGSSFGAKWARKSGAKAGAKAGAIAGMKAGASAGARAGVQGAIKIVTKTLEDAFNSLHGNDGHNFKIVIKNDSVVSVTGPGMESAPGGASTAEAAAASGATGSSGGGGVSGTPGIAGTAGTAGTSGTAETGGVPGAGGGNGEGGGATEGAGVISGSIAGGGLAGGTMTGGSAGVAGGATAGTAVPIGGVGSSSQVTSASSSASGSSVAAGAGEEEIDSYALSPERPLTIIPRPGEDPQALATSQAMLWPKVGGATGLVANAIYTFHSWGLPHRQEETYLNNCWRSVNGVLYMKSFCQAFIARVPALYAKATLKNYSVSFESVCRPGHFLRQKNYHYLLEKRDGTELFDKDSSFYIYSVMKYHRNLLFNAMHQDWYICEESGGKEGELAMVLDFYKGETDVLQRCSFAVYPLALNGNKFMNCKDVLGPIKHPEINGQPLPHLPHLLSRFPPPPPLLPVCLPVCPVQTVGGASAEGGTTALTFPSSAGVSSVHESAPMCVALVFINHFYGPFKLYSPLKKDGYYVNESEFQLKFIVDRPELHGLVEFSARDPAGKSNLLLNGKSSILEPVVRGCPTFRKVSVASQQGIFQANTSSNSHAPPVGSGTLSPQKPVPSQPSQYGPPTPHLPPTPSPFPLPPAPPTSQTTSAYEPSVAPPPVPASAPPSLGSESPSHHKDNGSLHYHFHYHHLRAPLNGCPSGCFDLVPCPPQSCPLHCCKRDLNEYVDDDELIQ